MSENFRRRTFKSFQRYVADILNVLHPFRGRVETAGRQVSELAEELLRSRIQLETWLGRHQASRERQPAATVSVSRTLSAQWSLTGEVYYIGATAENLRIVSNLWALAFKLSPRLVIDGGADVGISHGAQKVSLFAGLTVGVSRFRHPMETPGSGS